LTGQERTVLARLLAYLGEVEERRLDLQSACSSLFDFCLRRLGMSEDEACRRVAAARIVRRFPVALGMIARGEIHLTGLLLLRDHLTPERGEGLLREAARALDAGKSPVHLLQRGSDELVVGALCRLGFQLRQARRALRIVGERRPGRRPTQSRRYSAKGSPCLPREGDARPGGGQFWRGDESCASGRRAGRSQ